MGGHPTGHLHAIDANWGHPVDLPDGATLDVSSMLPMLTTDVLVHTWDLARAIGVDVVLDAELCETAFSGARKNDAGLRSSGMFAAPVDVPANGNIQSRLIAFLGRDPHWQGR